MQYFGLECFECHKSNTTRKTAHDLGSTISDDHSISNTSTFGAPPEFDIEFSATHDYGPPLNEIATYMTAVTALEDLCFRDQSSTVPGYPNVPFASPATWYLPQYNVLIEVTSLQVRYAIWSIQVAAGNARRVNFWPMIGRFFWRGEFAGRVDFTNKGRPLPPTGDNVMIGGEQPSATSSLKGSPSAAASRSRLLLNSTAAVDVFEGARLTIVPTYNGVPLGSRDVFGAAINAMVLGAEYGLETYCLHLQRGYVEIIGKNDAAGEPMLKYKSVIRAMAMLASWMARMNRFGEIDAQIRRDDVVIGTARIKKRGRASASE
ncbi:hypothetical protein ACLMJK_004280 [Lecanora helva]